MLMEDDHNFKWVLQFAAEGQRKNRKLKRYGRSRLMKKAQRWFEDQNFALLISVEELIRLPVG